VSPQRRDAEGRRQVGPTWESLVERQIREAMEEGAFTELPFVGKRLPIEDDSAAGEWALAHRMLKNAGAAPPWIESDKEARRHLAEIERLIEAADAATVVSRARLRRDLVQAVTAANHAIERLNAEAPTDTQHRRLRDPEIELERLERAFRGG
jgi:DnaJ homolog subfamily C member 28